MTEKDISIFRENEENDDFAQNYLMQKIPNYQTLLEKTIVEVLGEYLKTPVIAE